MGTFAIGDIHGEAGAFQTLLDLDLFSSEDTIVFLGDYVDRGPDVRGLIQKLLDFSQHYQVIFLMGNHEIMMLSAKTNPQLLTSWLMSGGTQTLDAYGIGDDHNWYEKIPDSHWIFLENGVPYFEKDHFIFVHAGLKTCIALEDQNPHHLFWQKYLTPSQYAPDKTVICGHTSTYDKLPDCRIKRVSLIDNDTTQLIRKDGNLSSSFYLVWIQKITSRKDGIIADFGHTICIDTYAYGGQWLTCLNVDSGHYWQTRKNGEFRAGSLDQ